MRLEKANLPVLPVLLCLLATLVSHGCKQYMPGSIICDTCSGSTAFGQPYHSVVLSEERRYPEGIDILKETDLAQLCDKCAEARELESDAKFYHVEYGVLVPASKFEHAADDGCFDCGKTLGDETYFTLIHYHQKDLSDTEIEVFDAYVIAQLCQTCRSKYDFLMDGLIPDEKN